MCAGDNVEKELLFQTVNVMESLNLTELLPVGVMAWYETQRFLQEREQEERQRNGDKILERNDPSGEI